MSKVEQVLSLIPAEDLHYVEEWKNGTEGFKEYPEAGAWLKTKDPKKDDAEIARALAHAVGIARKHDSEQRTNRGANMTMEECWAMEDRNVKFLDKCQELGIW